MGDELSTALVELDRDTVVATIQSRIAEGGEPLAILDACREGMSLLGQRFQEGEYFLSELLLGAEIFKEAAALLEPHLSATPNTAPSGTVVLATMQGDIHDLGKNVLATLLRAHAFAVHDLGVNVAPAALVETVLSVRPDFVGFSALLTTAFDSMKAAAAMLQQAGVRDRCKLMIGGGVTTAAVKDYVGADFQTTDATQGIAYCLAARKERGHGQ